MKKNITTLQVLKMKGTLNIKFTYDAIVFIVILIIFANNALILPLLLAACIHEAGHIIAIFMLGGTIHSLTVNAGGLKISYISDSLSYKNDLICAFAGPALGMLSAFVASRLGFNVYAGISLCINTFNLYPVRPLDGGRILHNLCMLFFKHDAYKLISIIEVLFLALLFCAAVCLFIFTKSLVLFFITCVLTFYYCKER